ncbi:hypothetical protein [Vagococcus salmoninarum]|nr:hypothetical protein [Vagococcus salmoninarum]MBE9387874.1 hypothetical protein [Vagococcus salmoninarum]
MADGKLTIEIEGVKEVEIKVSELNQKLKEAKTLAGEIASMIINLNLH